MGRALLIAALVTTHEKFSGRNHDTNWFDESFGSLLARCGALGVGRWNHGAVLFLHIVG
jgi:hypothetical protein